MRTPPRVPGREALYVRGVGSLITLLAFIAGIPALLVAVHARFWPDHVPSLHEVSDRLLSQDDGTVLLATLAAVAWIGWGVFTLIILTEIVGQLRGWQVPDLPVLGGPQQWAAALVAAVVVLVPTSTPAWAVAHAAGRQPVPTLAHDPADHPPVDTGRGASPIAEGPAPPSRATVKAAAWAPQHADRSGLRKYTVTRHDTLWGIAEEHLKDGTRWRDILALNQDLDDPDHLRPGQVLLLPTDATGLPPVRDSDNGTQILTVQTGDTLWDLAAAHLGDGSKYSELFEANVGRIQPDGGVLCDPDLIRPGWQLQIPDTAEGPPSTPPAGTPATPSGPPPTPTPQPRTPTIPAPRPSAPGPTQAPATPSPPESSSGAGESAPTGGGAHPQPNPHRRNPTKHDAAPDSGVRLPGGGWLALSVAGAVATALALLRLRRRVHAGGAAPPDDATPDTARAVPDEPEAALSLEEAWLSAVVRARDSDPDDEQEAAESERARRAVGVLAPVTALSGAPIGPPRPARGPELGTVPIGLDTDGREAVVALSTLGGLGLTGPGAPGVTRAILLALLTQGRGHTDVILTADTAGTLFGNEHGEILHGVAGVRVESTLDAALGAAEEALVARARLLDQVGADDLSTYRTDPVLGQIPATVLITDNPDTPRRARRLHTICELGAEQDIAAVVLGDWPAGVSCHLDVDGTIERSTAHPGSHFGEGRPLFTATLEDSARLVADVLADVRDALDYLTTAPPGPDPVAGHEPDGPAPAEPLSDRRSDAAPARGPDPTESPQHTEPPHAGALEPAPAAPAGPQADPGEAVASWARGGQAMLALCVLGPQRLFTTADHAEVLGRLRPKSAALLALLGCHRTGISTEQVIAALWPNVTASRANYGPRVYPTVARLRSALTEMTGMPGDQIVSHDGERYLLNPDTIDVDYWHLTTALTAYRDAADPAARVEALRQVADLYTGDLLAGTDHRWVEPLRQALGGHVATALVALSNHLAADDPERATRLAERVIDIEPHVEEHYRRAMRLHAELGRSDPLRRLYRLLETRLVDLDADVSEETTRLMAYLQRQLHRHHPNRSSSHS